MPDYTVYYSHEFEKQLGKVTKKDRETIERKLEEYILPQLKEEPHFGSNIKKLKNFDPPTWRYRVGNYRIFYQVDPVEKEVDILTIKLRKDAY